MEKEKGVKKSVKKKWIIIGIILLALVILAFCALYSGLVIRRYEIKSDKMQKDAMVRIAVIADLHSHIYGEDQQPLIEMVKAQKPDLIALVGDIVDDHQPWRGTQLLLEGIKDIAPIYYVSGNHEYWSGEYESIKKMISGYGVTVLSNERRTITVRGAYLCLCGIDDPEVFEYTEDEELLAMEDKDELLKRFSDLDKDTVNILMAHRPENIESYRQYNFDLVLSGHTHGGQVRIPLLINGLFAPDQGYYPKYGGGLYAFDDMTMIISRGLAFLNEVPRVFNPPEVVLVEITGE